MKPILLFDIDGTLLHVKRSFMDQLLDQIVQELNLKEIDLRKNSFAGRTDRDIFYDLIGGHPEADQLFLELKGRYLEIMEQELTPNDIDVIRDAADSVFRAEELGLDLGLCTGNFRETAFIKVKVAGMGSQFGFGGFGCNYKDRKYLPEEAHADFIKKRNRTPEPEAYVVIGDTPNDIRCARYFGARAVAVTTGGYSKEELSRCKPDLVLSGLRPVEKWLAQIGLGL